MPLFRRSHPATPVTAAQFAAPAPPVTLTGTLACSEKGCGLQTGVNCAYVDRRGRPCSTAWCPTHQVVVTGQAYCRRHAQMHGAVPPGSFLADRGLPDVDNRAPSLVNWVSDALEPSIVGLLNSLRRPGSSDNLSSEPVHLVRSVDGGRCWERSWKLYDHTGILVKVTVEVDEATDPMVSLRVGGKLVTTEVPPWIARRQDGASTDTDADGAEREAFYKKVYELILPEVVAEAGRGR